MASQKTKLVSPETLKNVYGIEYSPIYLLTLEKKGQFPKRRYLSAQRFVWVGEEIDCWIKERVNPSTRYQHNSSVTGNDKKRGHRKLK